MKKINYLFSIVIAILFLACQPSETVSQEQKNESAQVQEAVAVSLSNNDWKEKMNSNPGSILDVRTEGEYNQGHIDKGRLVDVTASDFESNVEKLSLNKSEPVYVYCRSGSRSKKAMATLKEMGFMQIYELDNGIMGWQDEGNKVTKD